MFYKKLYTACVMSIAVVSAAFGCDTVVNYSNGRVMLINDTPHLIKVSDQQAYEGEAIALAIDKKLRYTVIVSDSMLKIYFQRCAESSTPYTSSLLLSELIKSSKKLLKKERLFYAVTANRQLVVKYTPLVGPFCTSIYV